MSTRRRGLESGVVRLVDHLMLVVLVEAAHDGTELRLVVHPLLPGGTSGS
jgi:hypothetical protein